MRASVLTVCLLLLCSAPAHAGPVEDLADLTRRSLRSSDPARIFYLGLAELGDVSFGRQEVARALELAQVTTHGDWSRALTSIVGLEQQGDRVTILRDAEVLLTTPNGTMKLDEEVRFRIEVEGDDVVLSKMRGISVGKTQHAPYRISRTRYTVENGVPVAEATVGVWPLVQTVRVEIPPEKLQGFTDALAQ